RRDRPRGYPGSAFGRFPWRAAGCAPTGRFRGRRDRGTRAATAQSPPPQPPARDRHLPETRQKSAGVPKPPLPWGNRAMAPGAAPSNVSGSAGPAPRSGRPLSLWVLPTARCPGILRPSHRGAAMPPRIGYLLPTRERVMESRPEAASLLALAERAEALGYDSIWVGDSIVARPRHEPLTLLSAVAARTKRAEL